MEGENIEEKPRRGAHILLLPSPQQGHINPMLQFSKRLASKGLLVTFITTSSTPSPPPSSLPSLDFVRVFDGFREGDEPVDINDYIERIKRCISQSLVELIDHYKENKEKLNPVPKMVIYDSFLPWVLDVVKKSGLEGGPFFTQSCAVNSIYYQVHQGALETPLQKKSLVSLPFFKEFLRVEDLPSFISSPNAYPSFLSFLLIQFSNYEDANCLLVNTMDKLEPEVVNWMSSKMPVKTIGPAIPSMYLDKRLPEDRDYGLSLFDPRTDICIPWLDSKEDGSVVYAAMGSLASLGDKQMEEMALGLESSGKYFLWVVRASEESKLPSNFRDRTSGKGLIVSWCPQIEVLAHPAVGCFVTHCGWNSTLEGISLGVPMVGFPQWTDQPTNAKCVADIWRVGVRVKANDEGIVTREEMELCIRRVMEGEEGEEIKNNARNWKQVAREAMEEGGSSDKNIEEFVAQLLESS